MSATATAPIKVLLQNDPVIATLDTSDYDQFWLIAVDVGGDTGINKAEWAAIGRFRARGGAIFSTRDHHDLGSSICDIVGIGAAHLFHSQHPDPDPERNRRDDPYTTTIDYPNYHSGSNGTIACGGGADSVRPSP